MKIYQLSLDGDVKRISALPKNVRLVCAFGCFDGVHIGHRALLSAAVEVACAAERAEEAVGLVPAVWTFSEPVSKPWVISVPERLSLCGRLGIRYALCQRFEDVRTLSPREFVCGLARDFGLRRAVCGYNFKFGYKGEGDPETLVSCLSEAIGELGDAAERTSACLGLGGARLVTVVPEVCACGGTVSSTRIRALLSDGDMETAAVLLGRPYSILGTVMAGKQIGRTISRPTVNLVYRSDQLIPKRGVYFTYCRIKGETYKAVTNVGYRPTVNSDPDSVTCEAHLLEFSETVYGERAEIIFVHYHREERAFGSVEELSRQIDNDVRYATEYFDKADGADIK